MLGRWQRRVASTCKWNSSRHEHNIRKVPDADAARLGRKTARRFAVNLFDSAESAIRLALSKEDQDWRRNLRQRKNLRIMPT